MARVSLARMVYQQTEILIMDDPISALDAVVRKAVYEQVFLGCCKEKTRILATHSQDFLEVCDRIIVLQNGKVSAAGSYHDIKDDPYLKKVLKATEDTKAESKPQNNSNTLIDQIIPRTQPKPDPLQ